MITLDFETDRIDGNTSWKPPCPVGLAIKYGNSPGQYLAWGHPTENNCTWEDAQDLLAEAWYGDQPLLFHNAKFDYAVAVAHMMVDDRIDPLRIHDTLYLLFLNNPYSLNLSLKPSCEELLNWPPEEQDELHNWIMTHTECDKRKEAGAWISHAPGGLVGRYAVGDVDRTKALFDFLYPKVKQRLMLDAYRREQRLMPITYRSERRGVRVDRERLGQDLEGFRSSLTKVEQRLCKKLKAKDLDFNKNDQVADALEAAGLVQPDDWVRTATGRRSTSKDNFPKAIKDQPLLALLRYRGALSQCLSTFAEPWYALSAEDGRIHTSWNQVRTHDEGHKDSKGSRTGRLSASKPGLMNVPNEYDIVVPRGLVVPPLMRSYLLPEEWHMWLKRDFSGQEIRILAHFEDGTLLELYRSNPLLDPHHTAQEMIAVITNMEFPRKDVKITAFSIVYGSGVPSLSEQLGRPVQEAKLIKDGYLRAFPGVKDLQKKVSKRGKAGQAIRTWGGREYFAEPAKLVKGRMMDFAYKLLNYLIQGSAADQTKDCIIAWEDEKPLDDVFLATVHDEINTSAPIDDWPTSMRVLREVMDRDLFDCPMRSEGFYGPNWYSLTETMA